MISLARKLIAPVTIAMALIGPYNARVVDPIGQQRAIPLRPGVERLLKEARMAGIRLAVATTTTAENVKALVDSTLPAGAIMAILFFFTLKGIFGISCPPCH